MAKSADAGDLKSLVPHGTCGFEPRSRQEVERTPDGATDPNGPGLLGFASLAAPSGVRPALRAGNRNFLARLRRAAASSDWSLLIVKGGRAPLSHFPPGHAGVKPSGFAATVFRPGECPREGNPDLWSAPLREAQRDGGSLFSFTTRRSGNVDLRSARPAGGGRDRVRLTRVKRARQRSAGLRPASRGSAKPAPMTLRCANVRAAPPLSPGGRDRLLLPLPGPRLS